MAMFLDALWPDIVDAVAPLVEQVLIHADGLPSAAPAEQEGGGEESFYESDGSVW